MVVGSSRTVNQKVGEMSRLTRGGLLLALLACVVGVAFMAPSASAGIYGGIPICGENCDVEGGASTWSSNEGELNVSGRIACQLFNSSINKVTHGEAGFCIEENGNGQVVRARVYNQSGVTATTTGLAQ